MPYRMYSSEGLSSGLCPYFGFVLFSVFTNSLRWVSHGVILLGIR